MQVRSLGQEDSLEDGIATHSCILTWRIPQTEEPGWLWSVDIHTTEATEYTHAGDIGDVGLTPGLG